jgi:hypothetical protein
MPGVGSAADRARVASTESRCAQLGSIARPSAELAAAPGPGSGPRAEGLAAPSGQTGGAADAAGGPIVVASWRADRGPLVPPRAGDEMEGEGEAEFARVEAFRCGA